MAEGFGELVRFVEKVNETVLIDQKIKPSEAKE
jgi:hypothetical protein